MPLVRYSIGADKAVREAVVSVEAPRGVCRNMDASELIATGLVMNLLGIILLVVFGMPFRVLLGGHLADVCSSGDPKEVKIERWYTFLGWFGLALIVLGTIAQIDVIFFATV